MRGVVVDDVASKGVIARCAMRAKCACGAKCTTRVGRDARISACNFEEAAVWQASPAQVSPELSFKTTTPALHTLKEPKLEVTVVTPFSSQHDLDGQGEAEDANIQMLPARCPRDSSPCNVELQWYRGAGLMGKPESRFA